MCENSAANQENPSKDGTGTNCRSTCFCGFFSPIILAVSATAVGVGLLQAYADQASNYTKNIVINERIDKSHWLCDYADDIFQTLRETELKRYMICFRSQQSGFRPALLRLLKVAVEKNNLARTTLHLAVYLLDCFMDNFTIRPDKLNLTALTCLMVASKVEEADINMPKFVKLNELIGSNYDLSEFKNVESKILITFNFDLLRPTVSTFAEYFSNSCLTLDDYHIYLANWHNGVLDFRQHQPTETTITLLLPPHYNSYEEMATAMSKLLFSLVDMSLSYFKFVNVRPSILAASCIAAVRQLQNIMPIWTPYLMELTECSADVITPYVDALLALYNLHANVTHSREERQLPSATSLLCDSPDSGIVSSDTKSDSSAEDSDDEDEDEAYHCLEYPLLAKRRRLF